MSDDVPYETFETRLWAMVVLFAVSLFASSFPALSKQVRFLRIPRIVFFIGKHFGTGVILATAFVHLLQDAFDNLGHPDVRARWPIGRWTGLIVFGSLLSIFLVEYISTSYVDRLHSYSSPSPSPPPSRSTSRAPSVSQVRPPSALPLDSERTPLLASQLQHSHTSDTPTVSTTTAIVESQIPPIETVAGADVIFSGGHHRHEERISHLEHSCSGPKKSFIKYPETPSEDDEHSPTQSRSRKGSVHVQKPSHSHSHSHSPAHHHNHQSHGNRSHGGHGHVHVDIDDWDPDADESSSTLDEEAGAGEPEKVRVGHKRQVVGILMLQMGIMIHSLVIGLTLSITSGAEFTSLITAIIFHQLFEGLSLGIRIAALPASPSSHTKGMSLLKSTLAFTFAITTPVGIALGLVLFGNGRSAGAQLKLTEGLLSAVSAGMLIYAACVEMLAGDFVMDPSLWKRSIADQVMAVGSLLLGAGCMTALGLFD